jgi:trehalose 6-phosphate synthase
VLLQTSDNFPRSVAALRRYDVLLVNPVRDGLNLVAKEGALLNENDGVLALSREAGVWEELSRVALEINPFDVAGTADTLAAALTMTPAERTQHAAELRKAASARAPRAWLDDQIRVAAEDG